MPFDFPLRVFVPSCEAHFSTHLSKLFVFFRFPETKIPKIKVYNTFFEDYLHIYKLLTNRRLQRI